MPGRRRTRGAEKGGPGTRVVRVLVLATAAAVVIGTGNLATAATHGMHRDAGRGAGHGRSEAPHTAAKNKHGRSAPLPPEQAGTAKTVTKHLGYTGDGTADTFRYPGAGYVKVHFSRLVVRPGDSVTVSDPAGRQVYSYRADPRLLHVPADSPATDSDAHGFSAMSVTGDTAVVTLHRTLPGPDLGKLGVDVDRVTHGFTPDERAGRRKAAEGRRTPGQPESVCGNDDSKDVVCYRSQYPTEFANARPVARLLINGNTLCTAWRLTADNRMLTNNHCLANANDVRNTEVWFDYRCTTCGGSGTDQVTKVTGDQLLKTDHTLDYTLFTVNNFDAISDFGHLDLDLRRPVAGEEIYIPEHPEGEPERLAITSDQDNGGICRDDQAVSDGYGTGTDTAYRCDTAPGASGSPVISRKTHKVLALHHFGGCPNDGVRMELIYPQIRTLL